MKTLKELADIGAAAAYFKLKRFHTIYVDNSREHYPEDEPARQAFAQAVRDAVLAELVTKPDASPKWKLPDPPEGREWHRADWTEEMLPEGYRPLILNETPQQGDEVFRSYSTWCKQEVWELKFNASADEYHQRTTRPLPPVTKTIPLDMGDIRATDEFKSKWSHIIETADYWCDDEVGLVWSGDAPTYADLATNYLRRQHGSDEWKPCTKEISANQH